MACGRSWNPGAVRAVEIEIPPDLRHRTKEILQQDLDDGARRTSRLFALLLILQWIFVSGVTIWMTPYTWEGAASVIHPNCWEAIALGAIVVAYPIWSGIRRPIGDLTRHQIAIAQMGIGAILIHVSHGRIEAHFHIFGSLAFLSFYRDWRVLATASAFVLFDHCIRGIVAPMSIYGVSGGAEWRWIEHAGWVVFEDVFLIYAINQSLTRATHDAWHRARLEQTNELIEKAVEERTTSLTARTNELRTSEEARKQSESRHRSIVKTSMDCIITIDTLGRVLEFNPAAERTFGYDATEVEGRDINSLIVPRQHRNPLSGIALILASGETWVAGRRYTGLPAVRKDGSEFPVELTVVPYELEGQLALTAILRDITTLVEAEQRREATAEELRRAKERAEAADQAKSQFLANMSHEFRTPMGAIIGYAEMLLDPRLGVEERVRTLQAIIRNGQHLGMLINDILDLSKIESGRMTFERLPCDLRQAIAEALSVATVAAQSKGLALHVTPVGSVPRRITTDPTRLRQVLDNLLSNAVKFTSEGKRIDIRLRIEVVAESLRLAIDVEDQGVGIAPAQFSRLFTPFSQADASTTRKYGGTGLGLSICKRIAENLGGGIAVRSEPGVGSCFTVTLPVSPDDMSETLDEEQFIRESQVIRARPNGTVYAMTGRVLVVDDSPDNRTIVRFFLERAGLCVAEAENGAEGVEKALASTFEVILMDMQMPQLDGYAATSLLRQKGYDRAIIALTAHAMSGDEEKCLQAGSNAYLTKPVEPDRLLEMVSRHLASRSWVVKFAESIRRIPAPMPPPPGDAKSDLKTRYRQSLPDKLRTLRQAYYEGNFTELQSHAHKLSGSAGMYGFPAVGEVSRRLEEACLQGSTNEALDFLLEELEQTCRVSCEDSWPTEPSPSPLLKV